MVGTVGRGGKTKDRITMYYVMVVCLRKLTKFPGKSWLWTWRTRIPSRKWIVQLRHLLWQIGDENWVCFSYEGFWTGCNNLCLVLVYFPVKWRVESDFSALGTYRPRRNHRWSSLAGTRPPDRFFFVFNSDSADEVMESSTPQNCEIQYSYKIIYNIYQ